MTLNIEEIKRRAYAYGNATTDAASNGVSAEPKDSALAPIRHRQQDFFLAQIFDAPLKDDQATMEHPMFSLSKTPDLKIRVYEHNGTSTRSPLAARSPDCRSARPSCTACPDTCRAFASSRWRIR
jgi:hypothetical protein